MKFSREGEEDGMKSFQGYIGKDEFGIHRIYIKIEDIPEVILERLKKKLKFECSDCGQYVTYLVINMVSFVGGIKSWTEGREVLTDMYFDCGVCAIGG